MTHPAPARSPEEQPARDRKAEHIQLALESRMQASACHFSEYAFENSALPEIDFAEIEIGTEFLGKPLAAPLLISSMTGGTELATRINRNLAEAAKRCRVALGIGSQRRALEDPSLEASFQVASRATGIPLLANLGAVQLNYGFGLKECEAAVAMIQADGLVLHLNPLQEAIQPEGQTNFKDLLGKIEAITRRLSVPVIVKEVGAGISAATAQQLKQHGVHIIDTAGASGTSWARIEAQRAEQTSLGKLFGDWGIPTPESIRQVSSVADVTVIGSGGIRSGLDAAKAVALGAHLVGIAQPFLKAAMDSAERVVEQIEQTVHELKISMFCAGCRTLNDLRRTPLVKRS